MDAVSTAKVPPVVVHHALRVPGDTLFAVGAVALVWFVAGLKTGHSLKRDTAEGSLAKEPKPIS